MKRNKMSINMSFIKNKTWFSIMFVIFSACGILLGFGFNIKASGESRVKEIETELEKKIKVEFSIVGVIDENNIAAKIDNSEEIYKIPISTNDFLAKKDNKLVKEMTKEEFLKMSSKGWSEFNKLDDERDSYSGAVFFGISLGLLIAYGIASFIVCFEDDLEMVKGVFPVVIVWIAWISLMVGSILGLAL